MKCVGAGLLVVSLERQLAGFPHLGAVSRWLATLSELVIAL